MPNILCSVYPTFINVLYSLILLDEQVYPVVIVLKLAVPITHSLIALSEQPSGQLVTSLLLLLPIAVYTKSHHGWYRSNNHDRYELIL